jgi:hypothetical protein
LLGIKEYFPQWKICLNGILPFTRVGWCDRKPWKKPLNRPTKIYA